MILALTPDAYSNRNPADQALAAVDHPEGNALAEGMQQLSLARNALD